MRSLFFLVAFPVFSLSSFGQEAKMYSSTDSLALTSLPVRWQQYWNSHNMDAMGTMLRDDVDFVNVAGVWLKGKQATINDHKQKHEGIIFRKTVYGKPNRLRLNT